ncbi:hypothetical protein LGH83_13660 [Lichenihabitans sp. PAMC28606]|uniref:hypothetical protein n=1 Tax=Lichenihabitans sp. PAMC28606 TaxID=2880932 RepID=UPI001D0ABC86|nr:hypothetical protein [Lichenihabitans sp. PAMC28606]UDL93610.1 hypothetical protein LGH83_13660 [Lichenihabitans sp. PAMC28606]
MKVLLDLTRLRHEGKITADEYDKLIRLSERETGSMALNLLVAFGVVAVGGATLALAPSIATAVALGIVITGLGLALRPRAPLAMLATICILVGALLLSGSLLVEAGGSPPAFVLVALLLAVAAGLTESGLLIGASVLALAGALGGAGSYSHASYGLVVQQPTLTIVVFAALALGADRLATHLPPAFERRALLAARTSLLLVNFGFWVGSLWGDNLDWLHRSAASDEQSTVLPAVLFSIGWALALIGVAIWAARRNRRWVLTVAAVFGAIHFYTQWFERLDATPESVLLAGLITLGIAAGLWAWSRRSKRKPTPST